MGTSPIPLTPFLEGAVFSPEQIAVMVGAYEAAMRQMDLTSHTSPGAVTLAKTISCLPRMESVIQFGCVSVPSNS